MLSYCRYIKNFKLRLKKISRLYSFLTYKNFYLNKTQESTILLTLKMNKTFLFTNKLGRFE